jgi:hypothetical protein
LLYLPQSRSPPLSDHKAGPPSICPSVASIWRCRAVFSWGVARLSGSCLCRASV